MVALMFNLFPEQGTHASLILAGTLAGGGAIVSFMRMTQQTASQKEAQNKT